MYRASDGYLLHVRHWRPAGAVRGVVVSLHGIQSHSGWYAYSSSRLAAAGYKVFFLDRRGSGLNRSQRGHAIHEERLLNDIRQFLGRLSDDQPDIAGVPRVLTGVSWGGKLAAAYAAAHPRDFQAVALLYPGLYSRLQPQWWQRLRLAYAASNEWGHVTAPIPLNEPELFTDSAKWRDFIHRDELALQRVSVDFLRSNLRLTKLIEDRAAAIDVPVLMMLAGRDDVIDNARSRAWFERLTTSRKKLVEYPAARHTLEFEEEPDRFIDELIAWLNTAVSDPDASSVRVTSR
ncbi:MAG TPA: alpha/beta fold hydrolase [Planctomycetaceae bacterium]|nr:alpha/beta fold hydrolase [Planctomycetaceae bacterium]